jgi:hypothetical protein
MMDQLFQRARVVKEAVESSWSSLAQKQGEGAISNWKQNSAPPENEQDLSSVTPSDEHEPWSEPSSSMECS